MDAIADIYELVAKCYFSGSDEEKFQSVNELMRDKLPKFMNCMNKRFEGKRYMVGQHLSIADFALGAFFLQTVVNESGPHYDQFLVEL